MWRDFPNSCATDVTIFFQTLMSKYTQVKNHLAASHVTRFFLWTLMSKYTPMKNRYLVIRWQEIFLNSYYYGSCMLQLFVCKVQGCCFRNFEKWKVFLWSSQMVIHLSVFWQGSLENFLSHECQVVFHIRVFWHSSEIF